MIGVLKPQCPQCSQCGVIIASVQLHGEPDDYEAWHTCIYCDWTDRNSEPAALSNETPKSTS